MTERAVVLDFQEIDRAQVALVGGKGAHLGELSRVQGVSVPPGFCVTTHAFRQIMAQAALDEPLDLLSRLEPGDRQAIRTLSAQIRQALEGVAIPVEMGAAITGALGRHGRDAAYAVRSSATAEDLPTASFAGQQDSYLNVVGPAAVLQHISRCWASLFTERAVTYRLRGGFDHRKVQMAVVVQRMVLPEAAGILFTADPVTGDRKLASVEAGFGLGEALVSGLVSPDIYKVRDGHVVARTIGAKQLAIQAAPDGGTLQQATEPERQALPALTDAQVVRLVELGRRIEAHFTHPQDIEWCLAGEDFQIVQSRPITTLFPIPEREDGENHVYLSVGHQQMMTDPMKALGLSVRKLNSPGGMYEAGGRMFVDATRRLASPSSRAVLLETMDKHDPLMRDALQTILDRRDFIRSVPDETPGARPAGAAPDPIETDPAIVAGLVEGCQAAVAALKRDIRAKSGPELIDFIEADIQALKQSMFEARNIQAVMAGMDAAWWLNEHLQAWLGEKNLADILTQSAPGNVTSQMGLALLDVADVIRPHPQVTAFLERVNDEAFLDELPRFTGGREARDAIAAFLDRYGMRCAGEIDITRPRWSERPSTLLPTILGNVRHAEPGAGARRFEEGRQEALNKRREVLERLRAMPDGEQKAEETGRMIDRLRTFIGYREYPKYHMVDRYFVYKQALLEEAGRLVRAGVIGEAEDIFHLSLQELQEVTRTGQADDGLIRARKEAFASYQSLTPPRVLTSDGEALSGVYRRDDLPAGALAGLPVSAGTVEGRARVILDMADADLEPGDILVTAFTDPSWTPLFVAIRGLVTEVGGMMTHGAVIAREYGLPAVVGVQDATRLIGDGQRIRVHGAEGYIEILS